MKIEVTHTIKFDTKVESLLELVAQALISANTDKPIGVPTTEDDKVETKAPEVKSDKPNVATKTRYFRHEGTGELITLNKGESLDFLENDIFDELTAAQFKKEKAANETDSEETVSEDTSKEDGATEDEPENELTVADLRVVAAKFVSAAKQKELKDLFGEFNDENDVPAVKLSAIQPKDFQAFMERAKERLAELGVE